MPHGVPQGLTPWPRQFNNFINELHTEPVCTGRYEECLILQRDWTGWGIGQRRISWSSPEGNAQSCIQRGITCYTNRSQECTLQQRRAAAPQTASAELPGHPSPLLSTTEVWLQCCSCPGLTVQEEHEQPSRGPWRWLRDWSIFTWKQGERAGTAQLGREQLRRHPISINVW